MRKSSNLRQSLPSVESNGASNESSPTTMTIKTRRVSFANKKHVKQFCDSLEQGTLWDNTYEETDSSQIRNSHNSNNFEQTNVGEQGSERFDRYSDKSLQPILPIGDSNFIQPESFFNIDSELERAGSTDNKYEDIRHRSASGTESLPETELSSIDPRDTSKFDDTLKDVSNEMDETAPVSSLLRSVAFDPDFFASRQETNNSPQKVTIFHDTSMDFTRGVPSVPSFEKYQNDKENIAKTTIFRDEPMDFTEVVRNVSKFDEHSHMIYDKENITKTTIFRDKSMDFTEIVPNVPSFEKHRNRIYEKENTEKTTIFHDKSVDFTEVVPNVPSFEMHRNRIYEKENTEKTTIFHDKSVDFTEVVPNVPSFEKHRNRIYEKENTERTIFHDKSVDFTEVVPNVPSFEKHRNKIYEKENTEKTTIFHDKSVDFTEVVPNVPSFEKHLNKIYEKENTEKTTIFHDKSVDYTDVVQNLRSFEKHENIAHENTSRRMPGVSEKIENFSNANELQTFIEGMKENVSNMADMVETRSNFNFDKIVPPKSEFTTSNDENHRKLKNISVFHNEPVKITESQKNLLREKRNKDESCSGFRKDFITDYSTAMNRQRVNSPGATQQTKVFSDDSMELTIAVQFPSQSLPENYENNKNYGFSGTVDLQDKENIRTGSSRMKPIFLDKENCPIDKENYFPINTGMCSRGTEIQKPRIKSIQNLKFPDSKYLEKNHVGSSESCERRCSNDLGDVSGITPFSRVHQHATSNKSCFENNEKREVTMFGNEEMEFTVPVSTSFLKAHSNLEKKIGAKETEEEKGRGSDVFSINNEFSPSETATMGKHLFHNVSQMNAEHSSLGIQIPLEKDLQINPESSIMENENMDLTVTGSLSSKMNRNRSDKLLEKPRLFEACSINNVQFENAGSIEENIEKLQNTDFVTTGEYDESDTELCELGKKTEDSNSKDISGVSSFCLENKNEHFNEQMPIADLQSSRETSLISTGNTSTGRNNSSLFASESFDEFRSDAIKLHENMDLPSQNETSNVSMSIDNVEQQNNENIMITTINKNRSEGQLVVQDIDGSYLVLENSVPDESIRTEVPDRRINASELMDVEDQEELIMEGEPLKPDSFSILKETIENLSKRSETIWSIKRLDERVVALNFLSKSIVLVIRLEQTSDPEGTGTIKRIELLSQLVRGKADPGLQLTHDLVLKKLDAPSLSEYFQTYEEIPQLLEKVSSQVKMGMEFQFLLDHLRNHNVMEFDGNRITFLAHTRDIKEGIIVNVNIEMKPFEEINPNDVTVACLLGGEKIKKSEIQQLVTNIKRDHRFLQLYMTDVMHYLDLSQETSVRTGSV